MARPGKGLIVTSRAEHPLIVTMNLLAKAPESPPPALVNAALHHAYNLYEEVKDLEKIDTRKLNLEALKDLCAHLVTLEYLLASLADQAAAIGSAELEAAFTSCSAALEAAVRHLRTAAEFASAYDSMKGTAT